MTRLSIVIVNYKSTDYLQPCLQSIKRETRLDHRVVVVDNASQDQGLEDLKAAHPGVLFIHNDHNRGFAKAVNQGLRCLPARFYLLLNPDTLIVDSAIDKTLDFLTEGARAGIVGCRVENPDGTLQMASKRSIPTPSSALYRLLGLSLLLPRSRRFGRYNLTHLDESRNHLVEAVSGSFLMFRHELLADIGYLDEDFFLYGEDLDFCYRAWLKGWEIFYFAGARIIHYKRISSSRHTRASTYHFFDAMKIFYRKHHGAQSGRIRTFAVLTGIHLLYLVARFRQLLTGTDDS